MDRMGLEQLRAFYKMGHDPGDAWGSCMAAAFDVAGELWYRGSDLLPEEWGYKPGNCGHGREPIGDASLFALDCVQDADEEDLRDFGQVLHRYGRMLKAAGRDY